MLWLQDNTARSCRHVGMYTKIENEGRLVIYKKDMSIEHLKYKANWKNPIYTKEKNTVSCEAYVNIKELPAFI